MSAADDAEELLDDFKRAWSSVSETWQDESSKKFEESAMTPVLSALGTAASAASSLKFDIEYGCSESLEELEDQFYKLIMSRRG